MATTTDAGNPFDAFIESARSRLVGSSSIPLYSQLCRTLRRFIEEEELQPGDRFPTEEMIAAQFNVSRPTANRAVQELINQGWLTRERGRGTFVQDQHIVDLALLSNSLSLTEQFPHDATLRTEVIERKVLHQSERIAQTLALAPDTPILYLRRLRFVDERPVMVCDTYLPESRFSDLDRNAFVRGSLYATLEQRYGFTIARSERRVEAQDVIDPAVANLLHVPLFSPILLLTGLTFVEGEEQPIELLIAYIRERVAFKSTVSRQTVTNQERPV
jgi:GntR family transcriptional regulator